MTNSHGNIFRVQKDKRENKVEFGGNILEFYKYPLFAGQYLNGCFNKVKISCFFLRYLLGGFGLWVPPKLPIF